MAGDWIKFELSTLDKPEVFRIARILGVQREAVAGYLCRFWGWYGGISVDGHVDAVEARDVDVVLSLPGFADALIEVGWLKYNPEKRSLTVPNYDRHNGESSKKRALKAQRQARYRAGHVDAYVDAPVDAVVPPEKRREEKRILNHSRSPSGSRLQIDVLPGDWGNYCQKERPDLTPASVFEDFRDYWMAKAGKDACKVNWFLTWKTWVRRQNSKGNGNGKGKFHPNAGFRERLKKTIAAEGLDGSPPEEVFDDLHGEVLKVLPRSGNG